jgi:hypothetical protein
MHPCLPVASLTAPLTACGSGPKCPHERIMMLAWHRHHHPHHPRPGLGRATGVLHRSRIRPADVGRSMGDRRRALTRPAHRSGTLARDLLLAPPLPRGGALSAAVTSIGRSAGPRGRAASQGCTSSKPHATAFRPRWILSGKRPAFSSRQKNVCTARGRPSRRSCAGP